MDEKYRKESTLAKNIRKDVYQAKLLNKEFAQLLKVVVILKINLDTQAQPHVILFSTDLELSYDRSSCDVFSRSTRISKSWICKRTTTGTATHSRQ